MKKNLLCLLLSALLLLTMAACGASSQDAAGATESMGVNGYSEAAVAAEEADYAVEDYLYDDEWDEWEMDEPAEMPEPEKSVETESLSAGGVTEGAAGTTQSMAEKIIYTGNAEIETTEFDQAVEAVYDLMSRYGAFLESSSVTGSNLSDTYNGYRSNRTADFTLRVPKENYSAMTGALEDVGNVIYFSSDAQNITSQYMDTQSRLDAYETEETRLLEILAQAETVEDMITVESRLSEIRYEKEWLTSQLKNWDNQVSYSTVYLHLREVRILTPEPEPEPETYAQQLGRGFISTLKWMGRAIKALFLGFVSALPILIPLAVIAIVVILLARRSSRKRTAARRAAAGNQTPAPRAENQKEEKPEE